MMRDPYSGEQLRAARQLPHPGPAVHGPYITKPLLAPDEKVLACVIALWAIATIGETLGWSWPW